LHRFKQQVSKRHYGQPDDPAVRSAPPERADPAQSQSRNNLYLPKQATPCIFDLFPICSASFTCESCFKKVIKARLISFIKLFLIAVRRSQRCPAFVEFDVFHVSFLGKSTTLPLKT